MSKLFRHAYLVFRDDSMVVKGILTKTNFDHGVIILCLDINGDNIECVGIKYHIKFGDLKYLHIFMLYTAFFPRKKKMYNNCRLKIVI